MSAPRKDPEQRRTGMDSQVASRTCTATRQHPGAATALLLLYTLALSRVALGHPPSTPALAPSERPVEFHIPAGDASTTLTEFSNQSQLQLLFDYNIVKGTRTHAIEGSYEPRNALIRMLADTDLRFDFVNARTLTVTRVPVTTPPAATASAPPLPPAPPAEANASHAPTTRVRVSQPQPDGPLAEIRITGTNLRGEAPVGAERLIYDHEEIANSGAATLTDFLKTIPQIIGSGPTQDTHLGVEAQTNSGLGTGINLRGLGARATLVLLNGQRLASSGISGEFVDIESIPLTAIERIDILPDSASALYGANAVGGVVNFVMRNSFTGAESIARAGTGTDNTLKEYLFSQTLGRHWNGGQGMLSFELHRRDALPASARSYAVSDLRPWGGGQFDTTFTNPGNLTVGLQTWGLPAGQDGTHLSPASLLPGQPNHQNQYLGADLLPSQKRWSLYTSARQHLTDNVSVYTEILFSDRDANERSGGLPLTLTVPASNPFYVNPTGGSGPVLVSYNLGRDLGPLTSDVNVKTTNATLGVDLAPGADWRVGAYYNYAREKEDQLTYNSVNTTALNAALADPNPATAFDPFGDGSHTSPATLNAVRATVPFRVASQLQTVGASADGPVAKVPAGAIKLAVGADWQIQYLTSIMAPSASLPKGDRADLQRNVTAVFGELVLPLLGGPVSYPLARRLEISAAVRYENYSGVDHATTPKYGLVWSPLRGLELRGTWTRAIRAPTLADLYEKRNISVPNVLIDPTAPGGRTFALLWAGENATLREEHAESWTLGADFSPESLRGLSVGITWFNTKFRDRIQSATLSDLLSDPALSTFVIRKPDPSLLSYVCAHTVYLGGGSCTTFPAATLLDLRVHNVAQVETHGLDLNGGYEHTGSFGKLSARLEGTWLLGFSQADAPGLPLQSLLNTQNNPVDLRLRASLGWQRGRLGIATGANFTNGYRDTVSQPNRRVRAWTTIDLHTWLDFPAYERGWLQNTRIELNATNLFNVTPPFLNNEAARIGYDQENADPDGRLLSVQVRKLW